MKPLCFVLMPFGIKQDATGKSIDFDAVYRMLIEPAIRAADLEPLRADEELGGGIIHRAMFERLILCEFAVADLTSANANVFYELGVRHGVRPGSTVCIFAEGTNLPFDVKYLRCVPYKLSESGAPLLPSPAQAGITRLLEEAQKGGKDSPVFVLVEDLKTQEIKHEKTDAFRDRVRYDQQVRQRLAAARALPQDRAITAIREVEADLSPVDNASAGCVIDLMLSYRACGLTADMIRLEGLMADPMRRAVMVREQLAFALNREHRGPEAERVLLDLVNTNGPSSETYGLLGRIYKDRWLAALEAGSAARAAGHLEAAIQAYLKGFEADMRDAYPGINAVTLMEMCDPVDPRQGSLLPVVAYAVERRMAARPADYWDRATELELAVLSADPVGARRALARALALVRVGWEPESTARTLHLIRRARGARGVDSAWIESLETELAGAAVEIRTRGKSGS